MKAIRFAPAIFLLLLPLTGCSDSESPTIALPPTRALNGTFSGPMPSLIPGEDWSNVTMELMTQGNVSGTFTPKSGPTRPVGGTYAGTNLVLSIGNLPQGASCFEITMNVFRFEFNSSNDVSAFEGTLTGRCQGTVSGSFRMERKQG